MRSLSRYFVALFAAMFITFSAPSVQAQDMSTELEQIEGDYRLPEGRRCRVGGETFQCYNLEEYKELLRMDIDLRFYEEAYPNALERINSLELIVTDLQIALDAANRQIDTLQLERDRLFNKWKKENKLRLEAENKPMIGNWFAWGLAAVEAVAILTLGLIVGL